MNHELRSTKAQNNLFLDLLPVDVVAEIIRWFSADPRSEDWSTSISQESFSLIFKLRTLRDVAQSGLFSSVAVSSSSTSGYFTTGNCVFLSNKFLPVLGNSVHHLLLSYTQIPFSIGLVSKAIEKYCHSLKSLTIFINRLNTSWIPIVYNNVTTLESMHISVLSSPMSNRGPPSTHAPSTLISCFLWHSHKFLALKKLQIWCLDDTYDSWKYLLWDISQACPNLEDVMLSGSQWSHNVLQKLNSSRTIENFLISLAPRLRRIGWNYSPRVLEKCTKAIIGEEHINLPSEISKFATVSSRILCLYLHDFGRLDKWSDLDRIQKCAAKLEILTDLHITFAKNESADFLRPLFHNTLKSLKRLEITLDMTNFELDINLIQCISMSCVKLSVLKISLPWSTLTMTNWKCFENLLSLFRTSPHLEVARIDFRSRFQSRSYELANYVALVVDGLRASEMLKDLSITFPHTSGKDPENTIDWPRVEEMLQVFRFKRIRIQICDKVFWW